MNLRAVLGDETFALDVRRDGDDYSVRIGDRRFPVRLSEPEPGVFSLLVGEGSYEVVVREGSDELDVSLAGRSYRMELHDPADVVERAGAAGGSQVIRSVMAGKVVDVLVSAGDAVVAGAPLVVIEAMKMENEIRSPRDGVVRSIAVASGQPVERGAELAVVE